ncbi:PTS transporter subunit EIIC [Vagococcus sp. PNs007]|uniref:Permease IIC component n=1 Tax=Vagococcus proximus TaxID=2991417 RepID=A0ABT5X478_9ENTE|nr:PTS transporter subunit EIIC [Vagococcus proximus]MDF0480802.1 PTS transporter subunit EIIC [Vagococcus proximus]
MDKLFESAFMKKLQTFGQKLGSNLFLTSLQAAMMSLMGIIMVGAIFQIMVSVIGPDMFNLIERESMIYNLLYLPYQFTMNSLSLWVVIFFAYNYSKNLKMKSPLMHAVDALVCFLVVAGLLITAETGAVSISMSYLGAQGMFIGFIVVYISVHIEKYCIDHNIRIKMPSVVPPFLQDGFSAIVPLFFSVTFFIIINGLVLSVSHGALNVCSGFMLLLSAPLGALTSIPGMFILGIFATLLWCFGIHGTMIVGTVLTPMLLQSIAENGANHAAGEPLVFYPVILWGAIAAVGGTGNTLPLAILGLRSKSKQINAIAKVSAGPGWFGINEPLAFGMPIMYNPILCIPYVLSVPIIMILMLIAFKVGFLQPGWIAVMALLPMGFSGYLSTLRWQNAIWDYLMIIPAFIIYYPFFKIYEKQLIAKEKSEEAAKELATS